MESLYTSSEDGGMQHPTLFGRLDTAYKCTINQLGDAIIGCFSPGTFDFFAIYLSTSLQINNYKFTYLI